MLQVWGMVPDITDGFSQLATAYQTFVQVGGHSGPCLRSVAVLRLVSCSTQALHILKVTSSPCRHLLTTDKYECSAGAAHRCLCAQVCRRPQQCLQQLRVSCMPQHPFFAGSHACATRLLTAAIPGILCAVQLGPYGWLCIPAAAPLPG